MRMAAADKPHFELCRNCVRCPRNSPTNTDVYGFTSRRMQWREVVEPIARGSVSVNSLPVARIAFQACAIDNSAISPF